MERDLNNTSHFDKVSPRFQRMGGQNFFQAAGAPPVDPYVRAGLKPDLTKKKFALWSKLRGLFQG